MDLPHDSWLASHPLLISLAQKRILSEGPPVTIPSQAIFLVSRSLFAGA